MLEAGFGRDKTREKLANRFFWTSMYQDIDEYIKTCEKCQKIYSYKNISHLSYVYIYRQLELCPNAWDKIGIDLIAEKEIGILFNIALHRSLQHSVIIHREIILICHEETSPL